MKLKRNDVFKTSDDFFDIMKVILVEQCNPDIKTTSPWYYTGDCVHAEKIHGGKRRVYYQDDLYMNDAEIISEEEDPEYFL